ncbi:MAG: ribosome maturation factor RimP [Pseudomonadota bacterium]
MSQLINRLTTIIEPAVNATGFDLWGIEFLRAGKHSTLRIYIDSENGIDVDDCAAVSHQVSGVLDVEDPISTEYVLEVSSPGLDRPLFTSEQFTDVIGETVEIKTTIPQQGRRNFKGVLMRAEAQQVEVEVDGHAFLIALSNIAKARLVPDFDKLL